MPTSEKLINMSLLKRRINERRLIGNEREVPARLTYDSADLNPF